MPSGETIRLSFGPNANAVTSHSTNLEGLACTTTATTSSSAFPVNDVISPPLCDANVTHGIQEEQCVPRVLFVDEKGSWVRDWVNMEATSMAQHLNHGLTAGGGEVSAGAGNNTGIHERILQEGIAWKGAVHSMNLPSILESSPAGGGGENDLRMPFTHEEQSALAQFHRASARLANASSHSRYHTSNAALQTSSSRAVPTSYISNGNSRHFNWDDLGDEEEEEEEELDEETRLMQRRMEWNSWNRQEESYQAEIDTAWQNFHSPPMAVQSQDSISQQNPIVGHEQKTTPEEGSTINKAAKTNPYQKLQWMDYFMPPHGKPDQTSVTLPIYQNREPPLPLWNSYYTGASSNDIISSSWKEDVLGDAIRHMLESCDSVRGFQVAVDESWNLYGGLASFVLSYLRDECSSAAKFTTLVRGLEEGNGDMNGEGEKGRYWRSEGKVWDSFRKNLNAGLTFANMVEHSDLVLPLDLNSSWQALRGAKSSSGPMSTFEASAAAALALESATLGYRIHPSKKSKIGLMSGYFQGTTTDGNDAYPSTDALSFHEFTASLRPSNRHSVLELSTCFNTSNESTSISAGSISLYRRLEQGTSIERRRLEEERNRNSSTRWRSRGRDLPPGLWIENMGPCGGILSALTPNIASSESRSVHDHFSLSTSLRPPHQHQPSSMLSPYTSMIMEGMGIRYRPQTSVGTVVEDSIQTLIGSRSYGAGSYWKSILGPFPQKNPCTLTVLGNTTRVYRHLSSLSIDFSSSMSRKYNGYMSKDVSGNIAPEHEDCVDSMEQCMNLRDVYEPPMGGDDAEGVYFEDDED